MNVKSVEKKEKSTVELIIEVGREEFEPAVEKVYKKQRGSINVPGFRKGHAPRKVIEGMYGSGVFYEDAVKDLYPEAYEEAVEQEKLDVVALPKVEIQEIGKDGFTFKAVVAVRPEVKLGEYKGLSAPKDEASITEEDIDNELKPFVERATRLVTVEREAKIGDTVVIDFEGFKEDQPFEGGKAEGYSLELGSNTFIPGFEEQVVGIKAGEERELNVTFPDSYSVTELSGQNVVFKIKAHEVKEKELPVLDDEFAKDVSEFDTLEEFRADLGKKLQERREKAARSAFEECLIDQVIDNMEVEIPEDMVDYHTERAVNRYAQNITAQGIPFEDYLNMTGLTMNGIRSQARDATYHQIQRDLALEAVAAAEGVQISDEEVEQEYERIAGEAKVDVEKAKELIPVNGVKEDLAGKKAANIIFDSAKIGPAPEKKEMPEIPAEDGREKKTEEADGTEPEA